MSAHRSAAAASPPWRVLAARLLPLAYLGAVLPQLLVTAVWGALPLQGLLTLGTAAAGTRAGTTW